MTTSSSLDPAQLNNLYINTIRLAVEARTTQGWHRHIGDRGDVIGVDRFGASPPRPIVMCKYGFSVANVCQRTPALLQTKHV